MDQGAKRALAAALGPESNARFSGGAIMRAGRPRVIPAISTHPTGWTALSALPGRIVESGPESLQADHPWPSR